MHYYTPTSDVCVIPEIIPGNTDFHDLPVLRDFRLRILARRVQNGRAMALL